MPHDPRTVRSGAVWPWPYPWRGRRRHLFGGHDIRKCHGFEPSLGCDNAVGLVGQVQVAQRIRRPTVAKAVAHDDARAGRGRPQKLDRSRS